MSTLTGLGALLLLPSTATAFPSWFFPTRNEHAPVASRTSINPPTTNKTFKYTPPPRKTPLPTVAGTWFAGWHGGAYDFPPEDVSWEKYTNVAYAFAETQPDPANLTVYPADDPILRRVVQLGHEVGTNIVITVGGWTGSRYFSTAVGSAANRTKFINAITDIVTKYDLDGVDFDWEYPANQGIGCNVVSVNDTANFLELLKEIRASPKLAKTATLSAATAITPFIGPDGNPLEDVSEFAKYLDYIEVMNYDIWGSWSATAGPNAPLNDTCVANNATEKGGSAVSAIAAWTGAGFPADQIVLGVGAYGHSFSVAKKDAFVNGNEKKGLVSSYPPFNSSYQPFGDVWDDQPGIDECGNQQTSGGLFDYWGLITTGFLLENGTAAPGISYLYDNCTQTPSVYNSTSGVWVEYDDARSFAAKGAYINSTNLRGFAMWEAGGDFDDVLLDAIRNGTGLPELSFDCEDGEPVTTSRIYPSTTITSTSTSTSSTAKHTTTHRW